jgi:hypothetical protein
VPIVGLNETGMMNANGRSPEKDKDSADGEWEYARHAAACSPNTRANRISSSTTALKNGLFAYLRADYLYLRPWALLPELAHGDCEIAVMVTGVDLTRFSSMLEYSVGRIGLSWIASGQGGCKDL